jgi:hypothetical protein
MKDKGTLSGRSSQKKRARCCRLLKIFFFLKNDELEKKQCITKHLTRFKKEVLTSYLQSKKSDTPGGGF